MIMISDTNKSEVFLASLNYAYFPVKSVQKGCKYIL